MKLIANSLPKSGTHVLTRILDLSGFQNNNIHFSGSLTRIRGSRKNKLINFFRTSLNPQKGFNVDLDENRYLKTKYFIRLLKSFPPYTYSKAHLPYSKDLEDIFEAFHIKMLYIIRDPRDVLISHVYHHLRDSKYDGHRLMNELSAFDDRIKLSLYGFNLNTKNPTLPLKERINRSKGWLFSKSDNVLAIRFEDIIGERGGSSATKQIETLKKIENFLHLSPNRLINNRNKIFYEKSETFRKGVVNDWKNYIHDDLKDLIKKELGDILIEFGYENDYNW